jgi:hypothetical protein
MTPPPFFASDLEEIHDQQGVLEKAAYSVFPSANFVEIPDRIKS